MSSNVHVEIRDIDGNILHDSCAHNVVTTAGKQAIIAALYATNANRIRYIGFSTVSAGYTAASTALNTEFARASLSQPTFNSTYGSVSFAHTISANAGATYDGKVYRGLGLFFTSSAGTMYSAVSISAVTKSSEQFFIISWSQQWNP